MAKRDVRPVPFRNDFELFEELYPALRRFAAFVADSDMEPDDLVQDALLSTLQRYELSELDNPAAYLKRSIVNNIANQRRRLGRRHRAISKLRPAAATEDEYPVEFTALNSLNPLDRGILYLAEVAGEPLSKIAMDLELTPAAVRKRASRARAQLRKELGTNLVPLREER